MWNRSKYSRVRAAVILICLFIVLLCAIFWRSRVEEEELEGLPYRPELFEGIEDSDFVQFDNERGTKNGEYVIPNIVHFLIFGESQISYVTAVCILAAFKNQHPDKILLHTDVDEFRGPHWEKIKSTPNLVVEVHKVSIPHEIFGVQLSHDIHALDILRINIFMEHGGIFLDSDTYLVRSLDCFRKYEMVLGLDERGFIGTQTLVAHKDARFLRLWLKTYKEYYPDLLTYNSIQKPTFEILWHRPDLVHTVKRLFGIHDLSQQLYRQYNWYDWHNYHTIHLKIRYRRFVDSWWNNLWWPDLNESNIHDYPMTFGEMARDVYDPN